MWTEPGRREVRRQVGANIRRLREEQGLSVRALSELAGVAEAEILMIENGSRAIRFETVLCLARGLGVSLLTLCEPE